MHTGMSTRISTKSLQIKTLKSQHSARLPSYSASTSTRGPFGNTKSVYAKWVVLNQCTGSRIGRDEHTDKHLQQADGFHLIHSILPTTQFTEILRDAILVRAWKRLIGTTRNVRGAAERSERLFGVAGKKMNKMLGFKNLNFKKTF